MASLLPRIRPCQNLAACFSIASCHSLIGLHNHPAPSARLANPRPQSEPIADFPKSLCSIPLLTRLSLSMATGRNVTQRQICRSWILWKHLLTGFPFPCRLSRKFQNLSNGKYIAVQDCKILLWKTTSILYCSSSLSLLQPILAIMPLSTEAMIGLITLLVTCLPSLFCLHRFMKHRSLRNGNFHSAQQRPILPTTTADCQIMYTFRAESVVETRLIRSDFIPLGAPIA